MSAVHADQTDDTRVRPFVYLLFFNGVFVCMHLRVHFTRGYHMVHSPLLGWVFQAQAPITTHNTFKAHGQTQYLDYAATPACIAHRHISHS